MTVQWTGNAQTDKEDKQAQAQLVREVKEAADDFTKTMEAKGLVKMFR